MSRQSPVFRRADVGTAAFVCRPGEARLLYSARSQRRSGRKNAAHGGSRGAFVRQSSSPGGAKEDYDPQSRSDLNRNLPDKNLKASGKYPSYDPAVHSRVTAYFPPQGTPPAHALGGHGLLPRHRRRSLPMAPRTVLDRRRGRFHIGRSVLRAAAFRLRLDSRPKRLLPRGRAPHSTSRCHHASRHQHPTQRRSPRTPNHCPRHPRRTPPTRRLQRNQTDPRPRNGTSPNISRAERSH